MKTQTAELDLTKAENLDSAFDELEKLFRQHFYAEIPLNEFFDILMSCGDIPDIFCQKAGLDFQTEIEVFWNAQQPKNDSKNTPKKEGFVLPVFTFDEFLNYDPTPESFLIEGILPENAPTVLYGAGGVGKSYLTLQQAVAIATGLPYLDKFEVKEKRQVLIIAQEDSKNQIHWRLKRIVNHLCQVHKISASDIAQDLKNIIAVDFSSLRENNRGMKRTFTDPSEEFLNCIKATCLDYGNVGLIIADPLNKLYGADMNDNETATQFMLNVEDLCETLNVTVEILHHKNKAADNVKYRSYSAGGSMGAASFINGARHSIEVDKANKQNDNVHSEEKNKTFIHNIAKSNYMADGDSRIFYMQKNDEGVLYFYDAEQAKIKRNEQLMEAQTTSPENRKKDKLTKEFINVLSNGKKLKKMELYDALNLNRSNGVKKLKKALELGIVLEDKNTNEIYLNTEESDETSK
jgi:RecA-family ATPase